jgi:hypothetical protein
VSGAAMPPLPGSLPGSLPGPLSGALHRAILRQPWQQRRHSRLWPLMVATPALLALPLLAIAWLRGLGAPSLGASLGILWLTWLWWMQAEGLFRQNRAPLARLVPGHAAALRLSLLLQGALVTAAASALMGLALGSPLRWLWVVAPMVLALAWLAREPWLWVWFGIASPWLGELRVLSLTLHALPPATQLLLLAAMAVALALCVGRGGRLHRRADLRHSRWQRSARAMSQSRPVPTGAQSRIERALLLVMAWPIRVWRRRVLAAGPRALLLARLDLGLDSGGRWPQLLWIGGLTMLVTVLILARMSHVHGITALQLIDGGRFGLVIGLYSLIASALHGRLAQLWGRRREQALLVLLPGVPAGGDASALERRWRREWLLMWGVATAVALGVGAFGSPGTIDFLAVGAAMSLPLVWLAQRLQRRLDAPPRLLLLGLVPPLGALLGYVAQQQGVPAALSLALGVAAYALCAWRHRRDDQRPGLRLPVGRAG